jgi:hypothetical protein
MVLSAGRVIFRKNIRKVIKEMTGEQLIITGILPLPAPGIQHFSYI